MKLTVNIKKRLGNFLLDVSFETDGTVTGLLGASGCGKSLTLKCIAGIERPDAGQIILDGETLFDSSEGICLPPGKRKVGYLFQNYALFPNMTAAQNILCGMKSSRQTVPDFFRQNGLNPGLLLSHLRQTEREKKERLSELSRLLHLEAFLNLPAPVLSGGQAQRTALARILAGSPRLILLDEPFSALDPHLREQLQPEFKRLLHSLDCQTILVTHSRDEACRLCSRLCVMDAGQIVQSGFAGEVFEHPENIPAARLTGCKNIVPARKAGEFLVYVPSWKLSFKTAVPVPDRLLAIGLRARSFSPCILENSFPVRLSDMIEEPYDRIFLFSYENQAADSPPVWWRAAKEQTAEAFPPCLGISPEQILLLT